MRTRSLVAAISAVALQTLLALPVVAPVPEKHADTATARAPFALAQNRCPNGYCR